ncbi:MAG: homogentisate 1,2-dioxygenase [Candidatus Kapabacteria bacterium]|nr:homogentisate 1,2-dioxygenase [Candidatus Kapabacteria bacterium]
MNSNIHEIVNDGAYSYMSGLGNEFATEALQGALHTKQNSPQHVPYGLYVEQVSGTAFTAPRVHNKRTWMHRIRPSVVHKPYVQIDNGTIASAPFTELPPTPNQLRWSPIPIPTEPTDFVRGIVTIGGNGDVGAQSGTAIHLFACNADMVGTYFYNADGEMLIVAQLGRMEFHTECGVLEVKPGEICVIPRGIKFRVELPDSQARGYICENYGAYFRLPDLGPIGANGLAYPRHFLHPVAKFEDIEGEFKVIAKYQGNLWESVINHSPLNVVAWHGNYAPYKYDLRNFQCVNTVNFDHSDPSIFTVLTSPTDTPGTANCDFVVFPERWMVAENTFRPPWFHRNFMSEFMGLIWGVYDAKEEGFVPGGCSLHNCMSGHGPDALTHEKATNAELKPVKQQNTLAFMFETRFAVRPTKHAMNIGELQLDYFECWQGLERKFDPTKK